MQQKENTKTVSRKISTPKTKVIEQPMHKISKPTANDTIGTVIKPTIPKKLLPNQQTS